MNTLKIFFQLIQVAVGTCDGLSENPNDEDWKYLYSLCKKHSLFGIGFAGITRLPKEQRPTVRSFAQWLHNAEKIKEKNIKTSWECDKLYHQFEHDGMNVCILKGQSNLVNYPEWLRDYRTPGDIDVLVRPVEGNDVRGTIEYCIRQCQRLGKPVGKICYHHMEMPWDGKSEVEAHHRATWMDSYIRNRRLQRWLEANMPFDKVKAHLAENEFPVPPTYYNAVYQLVHIYRHLFEEGIGLRQMLDYYFVLQAFHDEYGTTRNAEVIKVLEGLGLKKFATATMWVLRNVFALPEKYLLCAPDLKEGKFLLHEILMAGNFGRYDKRIKRSYNINMWGHVFSMPNTFVHSIEKTKHNFRLLRHYPEEVFWEPVFRLYHYFWRNLKLWKWQI